MITIRKGYASGYTIKGRQANVCKWTVVSLAVFHCIYLQAHLLKERRHCTDVFTCCFIQMSFFFPSIHNKEMLVNRRTFGDNKKKRSLKQWFLPSSRFGGLPEVLGDVDERLAKVNLKFGAAEVVVQLLPPFLRSMLLLVDEPCSLGFVEQRVHDVVLLSAQPRHTPGQHVALRVHELAQDQDVRVVYELDSKSA